MASVLVVEDSMANQRLMRLLLESMGHTVSCAFTGEEGWAMVQAKEFGAIILDMHLPGLDGFTLAGRIKALKGSGVRVVAVTAMAMEADRLKALEHGCDDFVTKPIAVSEFRRLMEKIWEVPMGENRRILVIDDDQSTLRLLKAHLEAHGYSVETAEDGETGLRIAENLIPRVVILDLLLPGMDGFQVCHRIRENPNLAGTAVLLVTAVYLSQEDMLRGFHIGADEYLVKPDVILSKPVHLMELKAAVDSLCSQSPSPAQSIELSKDRVLVVEDDEHNRRLMKMRFTSEGYEVHEAGSGQEALDLLEQVQPHLILLDIKMPRMSGLDVLKVIRNRGSDVPVVIMTAHGSESIAVDAFKLGADDYLIKPFDGGQAVRHVGHLIEAHRTRKSRDQLTERLKKISCDLVNRVNHLEIQNRKLEEAYAQVRGLSEFNRRFIKSLSQDLRTPLAMILSFLSLLRDTPREQRDPMSEQEALTVLYKTAFRLEVNLSNLLYLSRIQAGALKLITGSFDLKPAVESILAVVRKSLGREGIHIIWYPEKGPHRVVGDASLFEDILINLLDNCINRMEADGEITVELLNEADARGQKALYLRLRDLGAGFSDADIEHSSVTDLNPESMKEGTENVRLNLVRHLATMMGWELELSNRPAGGGQALLKVALYEK